MSQATLHHHARLIQSKPAPAPGVGVAFAAIVLAMLPAVLDQTILATALPVIAGDPSCLATDRLCAAEKAPARSQWQVGRTGAAQGSWPRRRPDDWPDLRERLQCLGQLRRRLRPGGGVFGHQSADECCHARRHHRSQLLDRFRVHRRVPFQLLQRRPAREWHLAGQ